MKVVSLQHTRLRWVVPMLTLAVAYAVAAWLGLWLAIPPGYATALWPASGLALAGVLMGGARVAPGIWLGSFVVNLWTSWDTSPAAALLTSVAIPTSIGAGATLQALVGASLVRRSVGFPNPLTRACDIVIFLLLGGPLSCLVGATVSVTTLAVSGQIPWSLFIMTWWTWWVGDTLGVLIATPLVLSWLAEPRAIWHRRWLPVGLPLLGTLTLGFLIFGYARAQEGIRLRLLFERQAESLAHTMRTCLDDYVELLHTLESFYASAPEASRQAFRTFVQRSFARYPGLQALSVALQVPDAQRDAYEQAVRREGFADFQIMEQTAPGVLVRAARRPEYIAVTYVEPWAGNEAAFGLDIASVPDRREAVQQARDTGQPTATGRLSLVQDPDRSSGLLIFLPLYGPALQHATLEERRQNLHGYVIGVFQIDDIVEAALQGLEREGIVLRIEDETAPVDRRMLYDSRVREPEGLGPAREAARGKPPMWMHWQTTVELAGRRWGLHFTPTLAYLGTQQSLQPWAVMGGGLAFAGLLGTFLLIVTGRATVIEQLMVERTAQLDTSQRMEAEAEQRRREAEVLAELARTVNAALEVDTVLQRVTDGARELCDSDGAAIALCEPGVEAAVICYWAGRPYRGFQGVRIEPGEGIGGLVLATGRSYRTDDYGHDPRVSQAYRAVTQAGGTVAVLVVPIRGGARVEGLLYVGATRPRTFTDAEETLLQRLADHAAIALHNARLYAAAERRRQTAESLAEVGHLLSQSLDAAEVGQRVVAHVRRLLKTRAAALYQLDLCHRDAGHARRRERLRTRDDAMARAASRDGCGGAGSPDPPTRRDGQHPHRSAPHHPGRRPRQPRAHPCARRAGPATAARRPGDRRAQPRGRRGSDLRCRGPGVGAALCRLRRHRLRQCPALHRQCRPGRGGCRTSPASSWRPRKPSAAGLLMNSTTRPASSWPLCIWPWRPPSAGCRRTFGRASTRSAAISTPSRPSSAASPTTSGPRSWTI